MSWDDDVEQAIQIALDDQDAKSVVVDAINQIIEGRIVQYQESIGGAVNYSHDPGMSVDYGERLLKAALEKLIGERQQ